MMTRYNIMQGISYKMKVLFLFLIVHFASGDRIVSTTNGPIRGTSLAPKKVEAFLGIPYAEPPVGPLRLAKPVPKFSSEETYNANELPPSCVQLYYGKFYFAPDPDFKMSEDCLYLNLWVPEGGSDLKPIIVFIHGGAFKMGSTNTEVYDGARLSEHGDVIVATINYRVGTLGFFYGFIDEAPGSMGMYDQIMAIQWIKENAENFRGDPDNIVLMGQSAGGFSVSMHMISPLSKSLFRRAILLSGSAVSPIYTDGNERLSTMSQRIAFLLGCAEDNESLKKNPKGVVDCMKSLPPEKFAEIDTTFLKGGGMPLPRVGDSFLPENTIDSFKKGNFKDTEVLLGITRDEGSLLLVFQRVAVLGIFGEKGNSLQVNETMARKCLEFLPKITDEEESNKILRSYFDRVNDKSGYTYLNAITDVMGDYIITCGSVFQADYQSLRENPVYFYIFDYRPDSTPLAEWMGVAHFDEMQYVFGKPMHQNFTEYEKEVTGNVMDMWVAFAKTGNPNTPGGVEWPRYTYQDPKYLVIGKNNRVGVRPDNRRCEMWRNIFRSVIDDATIQSLKKPA